MLSWVPSMKPMVNAAISFCSTSDPDKVDPKKLTQMEGYEGFTFSKQMCTNIWQRNWSQINPHELLYDLEYKITPNRAVLFKLPKTRWWGDHVQITQAALIYDKFLHAAFGYDNGVFTESFYIGKTCWQNLETEAKMMPWTLSSKARRWS